MAPCGCSCQRDTCAIIAFSIVGGIAALALLGHRAAVVPVYEFGTQFKPATCRVESVSYTETTLPCQYCYSTSTYTCTRRNSRSKDCRKESKTKCRMSLFPCLRINVTYDLGDGEWTDALLHFDQTHLVEEPRCSYQICKADVSYSRRIVSNYAAKYEAMSPNYKFLCYANKDRYSDVLETTKYEKSDVFHGTFWPIFIMVICALVCAALLIRRYRKRKQPADGAATTVKSTQEAVPLNTMNPQPSTANQQPAAMPPPAGMEQPPPAYTPYPQPYGPGAAVPQNQGYGYPPSQPAMGGQQYYPPPQGGAYPPPQGSAYASPPQGGAFPPQKDGAYPPPGVAYPPPPGGAYPPPQGGAYASPPQGGAFPPQKDDGYPPPGGTYPPGGVAPHGYYPPTQENGYQPGYPSSHEKTPIPEKTPQPY